jgi:hypothetical protein
MASLISASCLRHELEHLCAYIIPLCLRCLDPEVNVPISRDSGQGISHGLACGPAGAPNGEWTKRHGQNANCMNSLSELCECGGMIDKIVSFDAPLF